MELLNIDNHLKSCRPDADVYTYSFTKAEVKTINAALQKKTWLEEVKQLLEECEHESRMNKA